MPGNRQSILPASWQTSYGKAAWWERIAAASHSALILDYDGTLAPFTEDRMDARPYPGVEDRIARLLALPNVSLVLVTGRSWPEINSLYPQARQMEVWASHGREHATRGSDYEFTALTGQQKAILNEAMGGLASAALPASAIERKPASIAIHWRGLERDEQELVRRKVLKRFDQHTAGGQVELLPFEDGVELRATGRTKGDAVRAVRERFGAQVPLAYLGDDHTDEEAFAEMDREDLALLVRAAPRGTLADYWMTTPRDVLAFLDRWIFEAESGYRSSDPDMTSLRPRPAEPVNSSVGDAPVESLSA